MTDNYIYAPAHNIDGGFRCKVPLPGSRQLFMIDGSVQGAGRPLDIRFEKGKIYPEALQIISIRTDKHPEAINVDSSFHFAEGSSAKLILCSHTFAPDAFHTDEKVRIVLEAGSSADIVIMQNEHNKAVHNTSYDIRLAEGASLNAVILTIHGGVIDNRLEVSLDGPHASCDISGLYLVDGTQKVSNSLSVRHRIPECQSRELFKGILDNSAIADFSGLIHVFPDAQKTEAYQECHNLLLDRNARAFAQPQLEIYADDVKCSHGATNGRLNEDELFYMRSRGIPVKEARVLQQLAFAYAVLDKINSEELRNRMAAMTERRLRGEFKECDNCCRNCC
ncbi:MAG TPA: SufD family Fe-S cluster assembly protein [Candidatus Coprenecus stercoravium]|uniref:SufD family Fe-S cluster assembly protein n=1 Tax=Candidatus Coprenecus stercoravium TaxID=2840735 RepID=A0A9D2GPD9_9BACT|nr:SufD family Fe-S cluster assembly protein [Candidatus Coprenecus stercoravium]